MIGLANIFAVARREYTTRIHTRSFLFGTLILLLSVVAIAFAPIIVQAIDQTSQQKIAVHVKTDLTSDPVATVSLLINASANPSATTTDVKPDFVVSTVPDLAAARRAVIAGEYAGVLEIDRSVREGNILMPLVHSEPAAAVSREKPRVADAASQLVHAPRLSERPRRRDHRQHDQGGEDRAGDPIAGHAGNLHGRRTRRPFSTSESTR